MAAPVTLLVDTRKDACIFRADAAHKKWQLDVPYFLGNIVNHLVADPRDDRSRIEQRLTRSLSLNGSGGVGLRRHGFVSQNCLGT